jgi:type IV pilus assembly protein PilQ
MRSRSRQRRKWVPALGALVLLGPMVIAVNGQSSTLRGLFEDAATAVKLGTVRQPSDEHAGATGEDAPPTLGAQKPQPRVRASRASQEDETLPPPRVEGKLPLAGNAAGDVQLSESKEGRITLRVRDTSLSRVLALLAQTHGLNIVASNDIDAVISITLNDVPVEEALTAILSVANYTWVKRNDIILITSMADAVNLPADVQGRQIQVFDLDFASAEAVAEAVTSFLSPIGNVTVQRSDPTDNRLTQERIVVEDLPSSLAHIADYIYQVDQPPRQVLIEAHILQVTLSDETKCGVDFHALLRIAGENANIFSVPSLASATPGSGGLEIPSPTAPAFVATFASHDLQAVIDALQTTTDAKTLGSPKLLVLNEQEANIQVGETIYYTQTTTTETSSQQGAASVETGVILRITPRITHDGRVLLHVAPQVSNPSGQRPSDNLPPNISRIELQSDVMLRDGEGMIIGGLIDERDSTSQQKVPYLGNLKGIGWLFRNTQVTKQRKEIVFALVPRIQPYDCQYAAFEQGELVKTGVPLFHGPLCRTDRPWDAVLPDGKRVYKPLNPLHQRCRPQGYYRNLGSRYAVPPHPLPEQYFDSGPCELPPHQPNFRRTAPTPREEELPVPELSDWPLEDVEIITDQDS